MTSSNVTRYNEIKKFLAMASVILISTMFMANPKKYPNDMLAFLFKDRKLLDFWRIRIPILTLMRLGIKIPMIIPKVPPRLSFSKINNLLMITY
jgi:hypothetical protein